MAIIANIAAATCIGSGTAVVRLANQFPIQRIRLQRYGGGLIILGITIASALFAVP